MTENQLMTVEVLPESSLSQIMKAEIDTQISTAKAYPRSLKMFLDKATSMATVSEEIAASCSYALPRGGKALEGPSVRLAEIVCSTYGNIRAGARVIANDGKTVTAQGICHDLESNYSIAVEVKRKITDKFGKSYSEDMQVITGNAACAIAYRNAVFKVVPSALVSEIYEKAKQVARGSGETLVARRDKALTYFKGVGVTDKQICSILEIKKVEDIDLDKLDTLRGMLTLIKNGESTIQELFTASKVDTEQMKEVIGLLEKAATGEDFEAIKAAYPELVNIPEFKKNMTYYQRKNLKANAKS